jgi:hypothetical protein
LSHTCAAAQPEIESGKRSNESLSEFLRGDGEQNESAAGCCLQTGQSGGWVADENAIVICLQRRNAAIGYRARRPGRSTPLRCRQLKLADFPGFLDFRGLTGFRSVTGLMLRGLPPTRLTSDSGSDGLKNTRQSGESWDLFRIMQTVTRSTSGISELQRRNASPLQACCSSWV